MGKGRYGWVEWWDEYYVDERPQPYDWFCSCHYMATLIESLVRVEEEILMVGCGNAPFSDDLHALGFTRQINIDNCEVVINQQRARYPHLNWDIGDVRTMSYNTGRFDVVFDKGLLDNMYCYRSPEENCAAALSEMYRVLRPGGIFIVLSCHEASEVRGSMTADPNWMWDSVDVLHLRNPRFPPHGNVRVAAFTMVVAQKKVTSPDENCGRSIDTSRLGDITSPEDGGRLLLSAEELEGMKQRVAEMNAQRRASFPNPTVSSAELGTGDSLGVQSGAEES